MALEAAAVGVWLPGETRGESALVLLGDGGIGRVAVAAPLLRLCKMISAERRPRHNAKREAGWERMEQREEEAWESERRRGMRTGSKALFRSSPENERHYAKGD